jgi:hypothetical protein
MAEKKAKRPYDNISRLGQNGFHEGCFMSEITLSIPDETLLALKVNADQMGTEIRLAAAVKLYELGSHFFGRCGEACRSSANGFLNEARGLRCRHLQVEPRGASTRDPPCLKLSAIRLPCSTFTN